MWNGFTVVDIQHIESLLFGGCGSEEDVERSSEEPGGVNSPLARRPSAAKESWGFKRHHEETMDFLSTLEYATGPLGPLSLQNRKDFGLGKSRRLGLAQPLAGCQLMQVSKVLHSGGQGNT